MTPVRGSVRRHVRINCPADAVWALVGDPGRIQEWFPGIVASTVEGNRRVVTGAAGNALEHLKHLLEGAG